MNLLRLSRTAALLALVASSLAAGEITVQHVAGSGTWWLEEQEVIQSRAATCKGTWSGTRIEPHSSVVFTMTGEGNLKYYLVDSNGTRCILSMTTGADAQTHFKAEPLMHSPYMGTAIRPAAGAKDTRLEIFQSCFKRSCLGLPVMAAEDLEPAAVQPGAPTPAAVTLGAADALPGPVAAVEESKQSVPDTTAVTELAEALSGLELGEPTGEDIIKQLRQFAGVSDLMVRLAKERATLITGLKDEGDRTFRPMEEQRESLRRALAGASGHLKQAIRLCGKHRNVTELAALKVRFQKQLESLDPMWATLKKANQGAAQIQLRK